MTINITIARRDVPDVLAMMDEAEQSATEVLAAADTASKSLRRSASMGRLRTRLEAFRTHIKAIREAC